MDQEQDKIRMQHEIMCGVLARSVVEKLVKSGCSAGELIDFGSEILQCITDNGFASKAEENGVEFMGQTRAATVKYRVEHLEDSSCHIHGQRVTLRPLVVDDVEMLRSWMGDEDIGRTFSSVLLTSLIENIATLKEDTLRDDFVVCNENGKDIGLACLFSIDHRIRQAETAKLLGDIDSRGKGYAKEASQVLLAYAFRELQLRRVYLRTAGFNLHNIKLNEKLGFRFEGILRSSEILNNELVDVVLMSIMQREFLRLYRIEEI